MQRCCTRSTHVLAGLLLALAWPLLADATSGQALASQGNGRGAPACQSCHGRDGAGQSAAGFPRLAGLDAAYLSKQLGDYAAGTRTNPVMQPIARALSADERTTVAGYYSRLPVPTVAPAGSATADGVGATLAQRGRWSQRTARRISRPRLRSSAALTSSRPGRSRRAPSPAIRRAARSWTVLVAPLRLPASAT